jgi:methionyl-tRNA formyltransferase
MKIIFISGVLFGSKILSKILDSGYDVSAIFSYSNEKKLVYSDYFDFNNLAKKYGIKNFKVNQINDQKNIVEIQSLKPDLIFVMGWSQLLDNKIINIPRIGVIGSHPTELPKYRGRAPIPWTILKDLKKSALTFFWMDEGVDNGDILDQKFFKIFEYDDSESLYKKIIKIGEQMILDNLSLLEQNIIAKHKQDETKFIEYWPKRTSNDGKINWNDSTKNILKLIRASTYPYPGAFTFYKNTKFIIWKAKQHDLKDTIPGQILKINSNAIVVSTGNGSILIKKANYDNKPIDSFEKIFVNDEVLNNK